MKVRDSNFRRKVIKKVIKSGKKKVLSWQIEIVHIRNQIFQTFVAAINDC